MNEWIAFVLPPATGLVGMRLSALLLGRELEVRFGFGLRFALGLALGMLVFSQLILLTALAGLAAAGLLAWVVLLGGVIELGRLAPSARAAIHEFQFQPGHLWLLALIPALYWLFVFGRLSTLEGTMEFDANAFWVFKAKIFYLVQGAQLRDALQQSDIAYAHLDYPALVPCLYTFTYGAVGEVDEFVNKVWPFWMLATLGIAVLSVARIVQRPHPLPCFTVVILLYLPGLLRYVRWEGGTLPLVFFVSMSAIVMMVALVGEDEWAHAATLLLLAGGAATKQEGIVFAAAGSSVMLAYGWWRGWLFHRRFWLAALVAAACMVPYFLLRLSHPMPHPESGWWHGLVEAPGEVFRRFPQVLFLLTGGPFFDLKFFHWRVPDKDHLYWDGTWHGIESFNNPHLSLVPVLTLIMFLYLLWTQPRSRIALSLLLLVLIGMLSILALTIASLPLFRPDIGEFLIVTAEGRHSYPFYTAWFLGTVVVWLTSKADPSPVSAK